MQAWLVVLGWAMAATQGNLEGRTGMQVRVFVEGGVEQAGLEQVPRVAAHLLADAGIRMVWLDCATDRRCDDRDLAIGGITVIVRHGRVGVSHRCATAAFDLARDGGTVIVDHACVVAVLREIHATPAARSNPLLASLGAGDLVGLAVAHEIGHIARLRHARTGIMRARLDLVDIASFRAGTLAFTGREARALRLALVPSLAATRARGASRTAF